MWSPGRARSATLLLFLGAHIGFGLIVDSTVLPVASMLAVTTLLVAVWLVGVRRDAEAVACVAGYIAASDVLWRMTRAAVPWEISKLALALVFGVAIVRVIRRPRRFGMPVTVLFLLAPSAIVTVERFYLSADGRERLSFGIGAHVALVLGVIFFSNLRADRPTVAGVLWMVVAPILAVATIATVGTVGLQTADFAPGSSNFGSSGGYGPNQVSALVGAGVLVCLILVFLDHRPVMRVTAGALALWFLAQSALTFSRGGTFNLVVVLVVSVPFFFRTIQSTARFLAMALVGGAIVLFAMIPVIQHITDDQFGQRFTSTETTLRGDLVRSELHTWGDNIAFGVGVGMTERTVPGDASELGHLATHTEYSRLLAEHGVLGLGVILVLLALAVRAVRSQRLLVGRVVSVALMTWAAAEATHSATRLAMVPFLFALAALQITPEGAAPRGQERPS